MELDKSAVIEPCTEPKGGVLGVITLLHNGMRKAMSRDLPFTDFTKAACGSIVRILHRHSDTIIARCAFDYHIVATGRHSDIVAQRPRYLGHGCFARSDEQANLLAIGIIYSYERPIVRSYDNALAGACCTVDRTPFHDVTRFYLYLIAIGILAI